MNEEIKKIGVKAHTLKLLKEKGIFKENLFISENLPSKKDFIKGLEASGFKDGDELSCRFSHPVRNIYLQRIIANSFDEAYSFYRKTKKKNYTILIHNLMHAKYAGTITQVNDGLVLEFVEGDWNADYSLNMDTAIFTDSESTWYLYQKERKAPYVDGGKVKYKMIDPVGDVLAKKIFRNFLPKISIIKEILTEKFNSLELLIDEGGMFYPLKLLNIKSLPHSTQLDVLDDVFEIKTPHDLERWDKKSKLLISIPANIDKADELMSVISEVKKYTNEVFISYGILSHPAILLREAGLKVERKISNYKVLKFNY